MLNKTTINITARDVINSTIIAVQSDDKTLKFEDRPLGRLFFETLGLPTLTELVNVSDRFLAHHRQIEYLEVNASDGGLRDLWSIVLEENFRHPSYKPKIRPEDKSLPSGSWIRLINVVLSSFVHRYPGKLLTQDPNDLTIYLDGDTNYLTETWTEMHDGLGALRFPPIDGMRLVQAISRVPYPVPGLSLEGDNLMGEPPTAFPVLIERPVYRRLHRFINDYGAVFLEQLDCQLIEAPKELSFLWAANVRKTCLVARDRLAIASPSAPPEFTASVFALLRDSDDAIRATARQSVSIGTANFRTKLNEAADIIRGSADTWGYSPALEFDDEINRFGDGNHLLTPMKLIEAARSLRTNSSLQSIDITSAENALRKTEREVERIRRQQPETRRLSLVSWREKEEAINALRVGLGLVNLGDVNHVEHVLRECTERWPLLVTGYFSAARSFIRAEDNVHALEFLRMIFELCPTAQRVQFIDLIDEAIQQEQRNG